MVLRGGDGVSFFFLGGCLINYLTFSQGEK